MRREANALTPEVPKRVEPPVWEGTGTARLYLYFNFSMWNHRWLPIAQEHRGGQISRKKLGLVGDTSPQLEPLAWCEQKALLLGELSGQQEEVL